MTGRSTASRWGKWALAAVAACGSGFLGVQQAGAQAASPAKYSFDTETAGFTALLFRDNAPAADADSSAVIVKEGARNGAGALLYSYKVEPKALRALTGAAKLPTGTQSVSLW